MLSIHFMLQAICKRVALQDRGFLKLCTLQGKICLYSASVINQLRNAGEMKPQGFFCVTATITVVWGEIKIRFTLKGLCILN